MIIVIDAGSGTSVITPVPEKNSSLWNVAVLEVEP